MVQTLLAAHPNQLIPTFREDGNTDEGFLTLAWNLHLWDNK